MFLNVTGTFPIVGYARFGKKYGPSGFKNLSCGFKPTERCALRTSVLDFFQIRKYEFEHKFKELSISDAAHVDNHNNEGFKRVFKEIIFL